MPQRLLRFKIGRTQDVRRRASRGSPTVRSTTLVQGTDHVQFNDGSFTVVGRDSHTHIHQHSHGTVVSLQSILVAIPNFRKIHQDMLAKATPGTGMWLLKGEKFSLWLEPNGDLKILWGSGIPGAGKTILATLVIDLLEALARESGSKICVAYVYIRYSDHVEMTVQRVLEVFVKQIVERRPDFLPVVQGAYAPHIQDDTQPTESQLLGLLRQLTDHVATTFVLDALDEAPVEIQLDLAKKLTSLNCKIFITSRPLRAIETHFPNAHRFAITAQEGDIDLLMEQKLEKNANLQELLEGLEGTFQEEILSAIKRNCGGMFLHASLQLDAVCRCLSVHDVKETLQQFPSEIEAAYAQTWTRILNQHPRYVYLAQKVLLWVLNAARSMTIEELQRAVAVSPDSHKFEPARMVPEATLLGLCHGLVVFEEESRLVRLVHYTAKKPLEEFMRDSFPKPHSLLAAVCIAHLADSGFQNTTIDSKEQLKKALQEDALLAYAHHAWAYHSQLSLDATSTASQLSKFVMYCQAFPVLVYHDFNTLQPLHVVALHRLPLSLVGLSDNVDTNCRTKQAI
ncbi:hypothetical protein BKA70DRAFT_1574268 [Coprinopsis sp. MPI-PUGE-AT-0042]|nr:hypothetical protein BKA70DRAFT_1574268 [Coprinopsis sp. MPI-PUGE-AT-0042]